MQQRNDSPRISVIIPFYNAESFLPRCLDSVVNQSYQNLEVILVNDGSTDKSFDVCRQYSEKDERITILQQENSGQAVARNYALDSMSGDFVFFLDADDYISLDAIELLVNEYRNSGCKIVQGYAQKFWDNGKTEKCVPTYSETRLFSDTEVMHYFCYQRLFYASPWPKIIHKSIMEKYRFPANTGYEDMAIMYLILSDAPQTALIPKVFYFYRQHSGSTMHTSFNPKKIDRIKHAYALKEFIDTNYPSESLAVKTRFILANLQLCMDLPFSREYKNVRDEVYENIKSVRKSVISDSNSKKGIRIMAAATYLGIFVTLCLGRIYKRFCA